MGSSAHAPSADTNNLLRGRDHAEIEVVVRTHTESLYRAACGLGFDK